MAGTSTHPHFDDKGALLWRTALNAALSEARAASKLVMIEYGREQCGHCRALVQSVLPRPELAELLSERFVLVAADCDAGVDEVDELAAKLEDATMLPFILFTDATGQFLTGSSGNIEPSALMRTLERLVETHLAPPAEVDGSAG